MTTECRWTRRRFLGSIGALAGAAVPFTARAATKPEEMTYSTYGGDYGNWFKSVFEEPFTKTTGIRLVHDIGQNPERYAKMKAYRAHPRFQLANLQDRYLFEATRDGLLDKIDYSAVPNARKIPDTYKKPTWLGYMYLSVGMIYNSKTIHEPPRNWTDLLNDRYKGRIFIDGFNHFGMQILVAMSFANGGSYANMKPGFKLIHEMAKRLKPIFISTSQQGMQLLRSGQVDVAAWQNARAFILKRGGSPMEYVVPETGDVPVTYGNAIVKNSGNSKWGESFLNFTASPKLQGKLVSGKYPANPTNSDATPSPEVAKLIARPAGAKQVVLDYAEVLPRLADWSKHWNEAIAG